MLPDFPIHPAHSLQIHLSKTPVWSFHSPDKFLSLTFKALHNLAPSWSCPARFLAPACTAAPCWALHAASCSSWSLSGGVPSPTTVYPCLETSLIKPATFWSQSWLLQLAVISLPGWLDLCPFFGIQQPSEWIQKWLLVSLTVCPYILPHPNKRTEFLLVWAAPLFRKTWRRLKATFWERLAFSSLKDTFWAAKHAGFSFLARPKEEEAFPGLDSCSKGTVRSEGVGKVTQPVPCCS